MKRQKKGKELSLCQALLLVMNKERLVTREERIFFSLHHTGGIFSFVLVSHDLRE